MELVESARVMELARRALGLGDCSQLVIDQVCD